MFHYSWRVSRHIIEAIRNKQEIAGIHAAMQRDGVALVRFLKWLEESVSTGKKLN